MSFLDTASKTHGLSGSVAEIGTNSWLSRFNHPETNEKVQKAEKATDELPDIK